MRYAFIGDPRSTNFRDFISSIVTDNDSFFVVSQFYSNLPNCYKLLSLFARNSSYSKSNFTSVVIKKYFLKSLFVSLLELRWFSLFAYRFLHFLRICELPFLALQSAYILDREKYDLVIAYRSQFEGYIASLVVPRKFILFTQGSDFIYWAFKDPLHFMLTKFTVRMSRAVFVDNTRDLSYALSFSKNQNKQFLVAPGNGGFDFSSFDFDRFHERELSIICVRPPAPYIDHLTLFRSLALIKFRLGIPAFKFSIVSQFSFYPQLTKQAMAVGLDRSDFSFIPLLEKSQLPALLSKYSIVVSPSNTDGIPISILEAMSCGCFPIAQNLSSLNDVVVHGKNGFLYPPGDHILLSFYILRALLERDLRFNAFCYTKDVILPLYKREFVSQRIRAFINDIFNM